MLVVRIPSLNFVVVRVPVNFVEVFCKRVAVLVLVGGTLVVRVTTRVLDDLGGSTLLVVVCFVADLVALLVTRFVTDRVLEERTARFVIVVLDLVFSVGRGAEPHTVHAHVFVAKNGIRPRASALNRPPVQLKGRLALCPRG